MLIFVNLISVSVGYLKKFNVKDIFFFKSTKGKPQNSVVVIKYFKMSKNVRNFTSTKIKTDIVYK